MEALNVAVFLRSIWMGKYLLEAVLLEECLHRAGNKTAVVVVADLDVHLPA